MKIFDIKRLAFKFWNNFTFELFKSSELYFKTIISKFDARNNFKTKTMATSKDEIRTEREYPCLDTKKGVILI